MFVRKIPHLCCCCWCWWWWWWWWWWCLWRIQQSGSRGKRRNSTDLRSEQ